MNKLVDGSYIEGKGLEWTFRENAPALLMNGRPIIINLDDKTGHGTHWVAAVYRGGVLYYADPFGTILNGYPPAELDRFKTRVVNSTAFQHPNTHLCGYYAIAFAQAMDEIDKKLTPVKFERLLLSSVTS